MGSKKISKRKQVLALDSSKPSQTDIDNSVQRITWASKYEIINSADGVDECGEDDSEHKENNMKDQEDGECSSSGSSSGNEQVKAKKQTVLAGLSGYLSTSDSDSETSENEQDLESEVQAFLKEVDAIKLDKNGEVVAGTVANVSGPPKAPPDTASHQASATAAQHKAMREAYAAAGYTLPTTSWQECFDSSTGYAYYWNVETNQVTWEIPADYQRYLQLVTQQWEQYQYAQQAYQIAGYQQQMQQQVPPAPGIHPPAPSTPTPSKKPNKKNKKKRPWRHSESDDEKIELITSYGPHSEDESDEPSSPKKKSKKRKQHDSDDSDSDSYTNSKLSHVPDKGPPGMEEETEAEEAARRRKAEEAAAKRKAEAQARRADLQREIGRKKMALESTKLLDNDKTKVINEKVDQVNEEDKKRQKPTTNETTVSEVKSEKEGGLALVAGYGDVESESEESKDEAPSLTSSVPVESEKEVKQDVKQPERITSKIKLSARAKQLINASETTAKARQTEFVSTPLGLRPCSEIEDESRGKEETARPAGKAGLGFVPSTQSKTSDGKNINFVKAETLNSKTPTEPLNDTDVRENLEVLIDKMLFLSEGKEDVSLVQTWNIELEVLMKAWESGCLKMEYLVKRLEKVSECLKSLESSAAPIGWLCLWNREEKKYSYQNKETGEVQWEFPSEPEEVVEAKEDGGGEEEMELCTTPPPAPPKSPTPPPPPVISSFSPPPNSPPPPPSISFQDDEDEAPPLPADPPLPEEAPPLPPGDAPPPPLPPEEPPPPPGEPLPPGLEPLPPRPQTPPPPPPPPVPSAVPMVDYTRMITPTHYHVGYHPHYMPHPPTSSYTNSFVRSAPAAVNPLPPPEPVEKKSDLSSELDSFYSDLATLEPSPEQVETATPVPEEPPKSPTPPPTSAPPPDTTKKKKKTKLAPGLALKKKNVSSLVAKWQKVQQSARRDF